MPTFKCKDIGMDCGFETKALTRGGLLKKIRDHASPVHNLTTIPPDLQTKIDAAIR